MISLKNLRSNRLGTNKTRDVYQTNDVKSLYMDSKKIKKYFNVLLL